MIATRSARLRILQVVSLYHPFASGAEKQALAQARVLVRLGHEVQVLTRSVPGYPVDEEEYEGIAIHRVVRPIDRGPVFGVSFVGSMIRQLARLRGSFDLVHAHQALWEAIACGLALRLGVLRAPVLIQPASAGFYGEAQELARTRGRGLLARLVLANTGFAAISAQIASEWRALGVPPGRLVRLQSGVDTDRFRPGPASLEADLPPRPRLIFTGRMHPQKNLPLLLEAWSLVAGRSPGTLILVGPGYDRQALEAEAQRLGIAGRVYFTGAVDNPEDYLRAADVFVLPSVAEGMSNSLLEAMACGLPAVVSSIGGNTDLVSDHVTGRLVGESSAATWAEILLQILSDPPLARSMGQAARARIESEFAVEVVVERYLELYRRMLSGQWP